MKRILVQTQLSNYTRDGKFVLECDSGWQMCMGRIQELLKLIPDLTADILGPKTEQLLTLPNLPKNVFYVPHYIPANAIMSRHHFNSWELEHLNNVCYDVAYINDPMQFRNLRVLLRNCQKFVVHNHFIDNPSCPKFPKETSLWLGQCEAALRADLSFWQCQSALDAFNADGGVCHNSAIWDDGYSIAETNGLHEPTRFDVKLLQQKPVIFVPNRVGGRGVSSDYTNCGKFLFDILSRIRGVFSVVAGNPNQKFSNADLVSECGVLPLVPGTLTRAEYRAVCRHAKICVSLYDQDTYGSTAVREAIELGALPLWLNCHEYAAISQEAKYPYVCKKDFSDVASVAELLLSLSTERHRALNRQLRQVIQQRCAYEYTTPIAAKRMGLL